MRPRYKQIKDPTLLNITKLHNNHILFFFCASGTLANKLLVIFYCHNVEQTGFCRIVLIKKQIVFLTATLLEIRRFCYNVGDNDLTHSFFEGHYPPLHFSSSLSCQDSRFLNISNPATKPNFFNGTFFFSVNLNVKEK